MKSCIGKVVSEWKVVNSVLLIGRGANPDVAFESLCGCFGRHNDWGNTAATYWAGVRDVSHPAVCST